MSPYFDILEVVESASRPGKTYEIRKSKQDGKTYCTCPAWIFQARKGNGICKHIAAYIARVGETVVVYGIEEFMTLKRSGKLFVPDTDIKVPKIINVKRV